MTRWTVAAGALALVACTTDVSSDVGFGTGGTVDFGLSVIPGGRDLMRAMAATPDGVVVATLDGLYYCPRGGCGWNAPVPMYIPNVGGAATNIARVAADDTRVYWTEIVEGSTPEGRLKTCHLGSCCPYPGCEIPETLYGGVGEIFGTDVGTTDLGFLAVDQGQVYWTWRDASSGTFTLSSMATEHPTPVPQMIYLPEMTPMRIVAGVLYGTEASPVGASLVSCPVTQGTLGCNFVNTWVTGFDVQWVDVDGGNVYFDGLDPTTGLESIYRCTAYPCTAPTPIVQTRWPFFAVQAGVLYAAALPQSLGACDVSSCATGPSVYDMPFDLVSFGGNELSTDIIADPHGGAYAYAQYIPQTANVGLETPAIVAVVHGPN
jgi:hypothetical protein